MQSWRGWTRGDSRVFETQNNAAIAACPGLQRSCVLQKYCGV